MIVDIDTVRFEAAGLQFSQVGREGVFGVPTKDPAVFREVRVTIINGKLEFFPHRSSAHKQIVAILGSDDGEG